MKELAKRLLKVLGMYHPLQGAYRQMLFWVKRSWLRIRYRSRKGAGYYCNICGCSYSAFVADFPSGQNRKAIEDHEVIAGYGANVLCPNCLSTARDRLLMAILVKMPVAGKKILHISPEKKIYQYLSGRADVTTADLVPGFYRRIDPNVHQADVTRLPYASELFDMVIANHVLEHIPDDRSALGECWRILKPGGLAILQVPFSRRISHTLEDPSLDDPRKQSALFGQKDHVRIYQFTDYMRRVTEAGFHVDYLSTESIEDYERLALQPGEGFFYITKGEPGNTWA